MSALLLPLLLPLLLLMCVPGWQTPDVEPVWRQLLRLHLKHRDPEVAQQAAAPLAE
jgi:hypothetical protein